MTEVLSDAESVADSFEEEIKLSPEELAAALIDASKVGDANRGQWCLDEGAMVSARDQNGWSPLLWSSFNGHDEVVSLLLEHSAAEDYKKDIGHVDQQPRSPSKLEEASTDMVDDMVKPVNSPLHWACLKGHKRVLWRLLQFGFSVAEVDKFGNNALHLACMSGEIDVVRTVLSAGVNMAALNWYGNDALALSTDPDICKLIDTIGKQQRCAATNVEFGPDELWYVCSSCSKAFSEEACTAATVQAYANDDIVRPVRYSNEIVFKIQEAESALETLLDPNAAHDFATPGELEHPTAEGASPEPTSNSKSVADGDGAADTDADDNVDADSNGKADTNPDTNAESERGEPSAQAAPSNAGEGEAAAPAPAPAAPAAAPAENGPNTTERQYQRFGEPLTAEDKPRVERSLALVKQYRGNVQLIADAEAALNRLQHGMELQDAVGQIERLSGCTSRAQVSTLMRAIARAERNNVGELLLQHARRVRDAALAETAVRGQIALCTRIELATHDFDGDLAALREVVDRATRLNVNEELRVEAAALLSRLEGEVALNDGKSRCERAYTSLLSAIETEQDTDPTAAAPLSARAASEYQRPDTQQEGCLNELDAALAALETTVAQAKESGCDEALVEATEARHAELLAEAETMRVAEQERIAVFEAAFQKKLKKLKKKGKKGKGKGKK